MSASGTISNLPESYCNFLYEISPTLQENFKERFEHEMERTKRRQEFIQTSHPLDPIIINDGDTKIVCTDMILPWIPVFTLTKMELDIPNLSIAVEFSPFDLQVVGNCFHDNEARPASDLKIDISKISIGGNVGLLIISDSFVPEYLDLDYSYNDIKVSKMEFATSSGDLGEKIWHQIRRIIVSKLHDHLYSTIIDFSVMESLADEDTELRSHTEQKGKLANEILNSLLTDANKYLSDKNKPHVSTPTLSVSFRGHNNMGNYLFRFSSGILEDISGLTAINGPMLYEIAERVVILATLKTKQFKHLFEDFVIESNDIHLNGQIKSQVYGSKIFVKLSFDRNDKLLSKPKLEKVEIRQISDIEIDSTALESVEFGDLLRQIKDTWISGYLRSGMEDIILKTLTGAFGTAFDKRLG